MIESIKLPNQVTLSYMEQGDPSGVPMLLLHGFAGSWRSFEGLLSYLPPTVHAFALTQRGHGEASKPEEGYCLADFAADAAAFIDALGLGKTVVVGHSMGSAVAQRLAIDYPAEVWGLVLVGGCPITRSSPQIQAFWDETVSRLSDPIDPAFVRAFLLDTISEAVPGDWFEQILQDSLKVPARVWKGTWKGRLELKDATVQLAHIVAPTLIVWGDQDTRCTRRDQNRLIETIPDSHLIIYRGAGHALHAEDPERLAADLAAFVRVI